MSEVWRIAGVDEARLAWLASLVALKLRRGDCVALNGDLGAGKTAFARALIRAVADDPDLEVPSPTFPIVQPYEMPRISIAHFDLYRLASRDDLTEIGFEDALTGGAALVEWPERAGDALPTGRLDVTLSAGASDDLRDVTFAASGTAAVAWSERLARLRAIDTFLAVALVPEGGAQAITYLQGDASARAYARVRTARRNLVLMDAPRMQDGPPVHNGLPYSRVAHLAEDVRPFVAIGDWLAASGAPVPRIEAADLEQGFLIVEDLGDLTFGAALAEGHDQRLLWSAAVDVLLALRQTAVPDALPLPDGTTYRLPRFDRAALEIELKLILDWYWPEVKGGPAPPEVIADFTALWSPVLDRLMAEPAGLFLRDFHSPNLFWRPDRAPGAQVAMIDFQDALAEPFALDLVSLLQDARVDVPVELERDQLDRYVRTVQAREPDFDGARFRATYAAFGAQRNTRLIGLWVRLLRRDGKPGYLRHMARTWDYLERNLGHASLAPLKPWYDRHFPGDIRRRPIVP